MFHFFRRIRKRLAAQNKPVKYMRYAIGEIVLVVIGILIALQINNWNAERKIKARFDYGMQEIYKQMRFKLDNAMRDYNERKENNETKLK